MSWDDTLGNMLTLDAWRREIGLVFDSELPPALGLPISGHALVRRTDHPMRYGKVTGVDKPISRLVMGTMIFKPGTVPLARALLDRFFELGGTTIDTAHVYNCEETVGQWVRLSNVREQLVLIGKGMRQLGDGIAGLDSQLYETLDKLQTDYLDLYLMHADDPAIPAGELVECLNEHLQAGRIRAYGGSNWSIARIEEANAYAQAHGLVGFAASSPNLSLAAWNEPMGGCISAQMPSRAPGNARTGMPLLPGAARLLAFHRPLWPAGPASLRWQYRAHLVQQAFVRLERVRELARKRATPVQLALAWVLNQPLASTR